MGGYIMGYQLKLKNGDEITLKTTLTIQDKTIERKEVVARIRELMDDQYDVTEYIKEKAIDDLQELIKDK